MDVQGLRCTHKGWETGREPSLFHSHLSLFRSFDHREENTRSILSETTPLWIEAIFIYSDNKTKSIAYSHVHAQTEFNTGERENTGGFRYVKG